MSFDFAALLVIATFFTAAVALYDALFLREKRNNRIRQQEREILNAIAKEKRRVKMPDLQALRKKHTPVLVEYSRSLFPVFFIVLIIRSFFFEPYQIPSGSMLPSLRIGDFILVNKFTFGVRLPVIRTKVLEGRQPRPGEVLVFRAPFDTGTNFIKRVVGVPGDVIEIRDNQLYRNNVKVRQGMIDSNLQRKYPGMQIFNQKLDEYNHLVLKARTYTAANGRWQVPENSYFVMGDNRGNSHDSRFWGFVPDELVVGQAVYVWMHWDSFFSVPDFSHIGTIDKNL